MRDDRLYLGHILEAIERILAYAEGGEDFAGMRDRVVHDYFGISLGIVWDVVNNHVPPLRAKLQEVLAKG